MIADPLSLGEVQVTMIVLVELTNELLPVLSVGAAGALGRPTAWVEAGDQSPSPTEFCARTRTWYVVPLTRLGIDALNSVLVLLAFHSVQFAPLSVEYSMS